MVKIAVVPPIPNASVSVAAAVNTGDNRNCLKLYRRVLRKFCIVPFYRLTKFGYGEFPKESGILYESKKVTDFGALFSLTKNGSADDT